MPIGDFPRRMTIVRLADRRLVAYSAIAPGPRIPSIVRKRKVRDKSALRKQLERWAGLSELRRIVVSHGAPIERDPDRALRSLAASLARP